MPANVFISYRRGPGSTEAVRSLAAALRSELGNQAVHLDVLTPPSGIELPKRIPNDIKAAGVVVLAIHPDWIDTIPRLSANEDWVRLEIEAALEFGVPILPVLLGGARMPRAEELPGGLKIVANLPAATAGDNEAFQTGVDDLLRGIHSCLPGRTLRLLTRVADSSQGNVAFALGILGALMLFTSWILGIHTMHFDPSTGAAPIMLRLGSSPGNDTSIAISREVGTLMAWNWSAALLLITPAMFLLFASTLSHGLELLRSLNRQKMIVYVGKDEEHAPVSAKSLWDAVARPSSTWCKAFAAMALVLGTFNWWQYSGQWYFVKKYATEDFLRISTGPDWNIGWQIEPLLSERGMAITIFVLGMYLVYGIGSALTYSYYAFLFNFFAELSQLATSAGARSSTVLRLNVADRSSGGLSAFAMIQRNHAVFCFWSLLAMYLMALRNAYLPLVCRLPAGSVNSAQLHAAAVEQCSSMGGFALSIFRNSLDFLKSIWGGTPNWRTLFYAYSEQNHYVMGSMLYILFIASFFFLISNRMKSIVETARHDADPAVARALLSRMQFESTRVLVIMSLGALSAVFLNVGPITLLLSILLFPVEGLVTRLMARTKAA